MFFLLIACGPGLSPEAAKEAVQKAAEAANPPGRAGLELVGKSRWVEAPMLSRECVEQKNLAFADTPSDRPSGRQGVQRISPTYMNQRYITDSTATGWCVLVGENVKVTVSDPAINQDSWMVPVAFTMEKPTPWFECMDNLWVNRSIEVKVDEAGSPVIEADLDVVPGDCAVPLPVGEERDGSPRPRKAPKSGPSKAEVAEAVAALDDALWEHDWLAALEATSCYNLLEDQKYGSCVPAEVIQVGPHPRGEERMEDGTPWTEFVIRDLDDLGRITPDARIKTMWHVNLTHKRTGRDKSFAVEWVDDTWKVVGVVSSGGADLTTLRYMYDLHRKDKRDIFLRRLDGEEIDEKGNPLDPYADEEEEEE